MKAIGLYKEPVRPPRPERKPDADRPQREPRAPKSNTRNARSGDAAAAEERPARGGGRGGERSRGGDRGRGGDSDSVESTRVYVGNLSYDVSEQDLQELFKGIGGVRNVEIVYNRSTHRSKGYGFVEMLHMDEAKRAVEVLHDQPFMGRKLTVSGAKSKGNDEREDQEERPARQPKPSAGPESSPAQQPNTDATTGIVADTPASEPMDTLAGSETPVVSTDSEASSTEQAPIGEWPEEKKQEQA